MPTTTIGFWRYFEDLVDPRSERTRCHSLQNILVITLCAVICGADTFEEIERFGESREDWLKTILDLEPGIPSHDTFNRVLSALDREQFACCFANWMQDLCARKGLCAIAIDGKACRSSPGKTFSGCLHLVNAWASTNGLYLGSVAVEDGSNEIPAIGKLLDILDVKGALVTMDSAGCQKEIVQKIREKKGDYLVAVKGNQPSLLAACERAFEGVCESEFANCSMHSTVEDGHGRHEERYVTVMSDVSGIDREWLDVKSIVYVSRERTSEGKKTCEGSFYISSLSLSAELTSQYIRGHWGIENGLHWTLDMSFGEDRNRTRDKNAATNLAVVRRVVVSLLKQDETKGSIRVKRFKAALQTDFLHKLLQKIPAI